MVQLSGSFRDITTIEVNNGCESAILNLIKLKLHILFYSNGLAIWHGFPHITHIKVNHFEFES